MSSIHVLGITFTWSESFGDQAQLNVTRPVRPLDLDHYKRRVYGETGEVNNKYDTPLMIDSKYARQLEEAGALVGRRDYYVELGLGDDPLAGSVVTKLIPVDDEIKKHFDASLKAK
jgi:hypothetical protein